MKKKNLYKVIRKKIRGFLSRRPHRSFRKTKRRDYIKPLSLPGYFQFNNYVNKTLWKNRKIFLLLTLTYIVITLVLQVSAISQDNYSVLVDTLKATSGDMFSGFMGSVGSAGLMFLTALTGGLSKSLTEVQQVYAVLIVLFAWLTTVWLLRNIMAGHKVKLRDGLYNAGAPIFSTFLISLLLLVQIIPFALATLIYSAAISTGLLSGGVEAMLAWVVIGLLVALTLYWITSTCFAMVIITLPGMYPMRAIQVAGDVMVGRRLKILYRIIWMFLSIIIAWAVVLMPIIIFDSWLKSIWSDISWLPIVPTVLLLVSSLTIVWGSSYIYLLYRKVVENDAD